MPRGTFYTSLPLPCVNCGNKIKRVRDTEMISLPDSFVICKWCNCPNETKKRLLKKYKVEGLEIID